MQYVYIALVFAIIAVIIVTFFQGKKSGVATTENKTLKEIDKVQDAQEKILIQPRTPADTANSLHNGTF